MPRNRGARERVSTGIYRDDRGFSVVVVVQRQHVERRYPLGTPLQTLRAARTALQAGLQAKSALTSAQAPVAGTLAADAPVYLASVAAMPSIDERTKQIERWVAQLGTVQRAAITPVQIRTALQHWLTTPRGGRGAHASRPYAVETVRHMLKAIRHLYVVLDGKGAANPAREVPMPTPPELEPREIPLPAVIAILRQFAWTSKTRARLLMILTTGMSHAEVKRLKPRQHVREAEGVIVALGRRKGGKTVARAIPMTRYSRYALRAMARLNAWGPFSHSSMHSRFRDACTRAGYGDTDWRPYDLRHTLGTQIGRTTRDERAVQRWLGHTSLATTARYTLGSVDDRVAAAAVALQRRGPRPPTT